MSVRVRRRKRTSGKSFFSVRVRVKLPDGRVLLRELSSPVQTRRDAEKFGAEVEAQLLSQRKPPPLLSEFEANFLDWAKGRNEESTLTEKELHLRLHLVPCFGRMYLDQIRAPEIQAFVAALQEKGRSRKYINNILATLRKLLNLAEEWGVLEHAPKIHALNAPKARRPSLALEELERYLEAARYWPERLPLLLTGLDTGLRSGELRALRWNDVDLKAGFLVCRRSRWRNIEKGTKSGRERRVPLTPELLSVLKAHRSLRSEYVFCQPDGKPYTASMVKRWSADACKRAGLARVTLHGLRHSFGSALANTGSGRDVVRELLGHSSDAMAAHYTRLTEGYTREAVDRLARFRDRGGTEPTPEQKSEGKPD